MKGKTIGTGTRQVRKNRNVQEHVHDPYQSKRKMREPAFCPSCGAVYEKGRWVWGEPPVNARKERCPACRRIRDRYPAGFVRLRGGFLEIHGEEILSVVKKEESAAKAEHPLSRIMGIEKGRDEISITTTDTHLPRRIGEALKHAYHGSLDFKYAEGSPLIRVQWVR